MNCTKIDTISHFANPVASIVAFAVRDSKPSAGEVERSGKRGNCAAFNGALPVQQRLETLTKVCALASAFNTAHIQRAALHCAQRYTAPGVAQRVALHSATLHPSLHRAACSTVSRVGGWAGPQLPCGNSDVTLS